MRLTQEILLPLDKRILSELVGFEFVVPFHALFWGFVQTKVSPRSDGPSDGLFVNSLVHVLWPG